MEVGSGGVIGDELVVWKTSLKDAGLLEEIGMEGTVLDPGIDDTMLGTGLGVEAEEFADVLLMIEAFAGFTGADNTDVTSVSPFAESGGANVNTENVFDVGSRDIISSRHNQQT